MLKILQARLQQYVNMNFHIFKLDLEKTEEPEIKLSTPKPLTVWITIKCGREGALSATSNMTKL